MGSRGSRGDTQGKSDGVAREALAEADRTATGGYKATKFHRVSQGVGVAHSTAGISETTQLGEREGAILSSGF
jgi:hypothetical protein